MNRVIVLLILLGIYIGRFLYLILRKEKPGFLFVSLLVFFLPFTLNLVHFPEFPAVRSGAFNQTFGLEPFVFFLFGFFMYAIIVKNRLEFEKSLYFFGVLFFIFLYSVFSPSNTAPLSTFLFFLRVVLLLLTFIFVSHIFDKETVKKGIYDGFLGLVLLMFILAMAFPVLGIKEVTNLFLDGAMEWAVEARGGRNSAIGIFGHPGNLALFSCVCSALFFSFFLHGIKRKTSFFIFFLSVITLFLSYSRSGLLAFVIMLPVLYLVHKKPDSSIFSFKNVLLYGGGSGIILLFIILFTPMGAYFGGENFTAMAMARVVHWVAGYEAFIRNPVMGVGLNTHLVYFAEKLPILEGFFARSPIHNIHIIILCEMGALGLLAWMYFIISNIQKSQLQVVLNDDKEVSALNLALIGIIISYFVYGFFGWAPFANEQVSVFLLIFFFASHYRVSNEST